MHYNIHFPPENISAAGLSVFPSGNNASGQIYTLDTQQKNKKSAQHVGLNHAARNVGSVKKKDVEGELGRISEQMLVVHVVQRM